MMNNLVIVTSLIAFVSLVSVSNRVAQAGPLHHVSLERQQHHETIELLEDVINAKRLAAASTFRKKREIYPEIMDDQPVSLEKVTEDLSPQVCVVGDLVYELDEVVPAEQPCLKCKCQPPGVHCETTRCEKKPGCRAIHKPNTCCPEYQCECDYEGRSYANGERLEQKPGTECKVCYCRGGEVQCAEVSCYIRNDCQGRHVPGKCCPKYEHCPPKEPSNIFFANEINETTKQTIKLVDLDQINNVNNLQPNEHESEDNQEITIHEIIPEIKEHPITNSPKREITDVQKPQLIVEEDSTHELHSHQINNDLHPSESSDSLNSADSIPDSDTDGSEVAEVYQHPPSVLRIGDKLLFLKKDGELVPEKASASTPSTVITIIGAEGLQRGDVEVESAKPEEVDSKLQNPTVTDFVDTSDIPDSSDSFNVDNEDDIQTVAESTYILSLVKRPLSTTTIMSVSQGQNQGQSTTETEDQSFDGLAVEDLDFNATDSSLDVFDGDVDGNVTDGATSLGDFVTSTTEIDGLKEFNTTGSASVEEMDSGTDNVDVYTDFNSSSTDNYEPTTVPTVSSSASTQPEKEEPENPAYPPLPDVMTQQIEENDPQTHILPVDTNVKDVNNAGRNGQGKILPEVFELQAVSANSSRNASNASWLKKTLLNPAATLPESILTSVAESDSNTAPTNGVKSQGSTTTTTSSNIEEFEENFTTIITSTLSPSTTTNYPDFTEETTIVSSIPDVVTDRSKETMESIEDLLGENNNNEENVTANVEHDHASILNDENASVEGLDTSVSSITNDSKESDEQNTAELVEMLPGFENLTNESSKNPENPPNSKKNSDDVEMIDVDLMRGHSSDEVAKNSTHEHTGSLLINQNVNQKTSKKLIEKRESNEDESIFEELDREIGLDSGTITDDQPLEQSEDEAKQIFRELVDEATSNTTPKPVNLQGSSAPQTRQQQQQAVALARIGDALAKLQLRDSTKGGGVDTNVLGILRDFFTAQYRAYN